ncbi:hypothetical protein BX659_13646 [Orenia metallireducens]|uniref:Uncharacterized protein n=2 Tax=Orenia TaxID=46468 RepID=A0A285IFI8_9FIRM|nr:hypothetical protein BX659_13646 [Orenia metallireducens]TDX48877.1 hypothetical protein C7959_12556 [Orenia marismortui]SNY45846.1 hypothetical protein SAMN06265827_13946 [Orenia metallireducens]
MGDYGNRAEGGSYVFVIFLILILLLLGGEY